MISFLLGRAASFGGSLTSSVSRPFADFFGSSVSLLLSLFLGDGMFVVSDNLR